MEIVKYAFDIIAVRVGINKIGADKLILKLQNLLFCWTLIYKFLVTYA